MNDKGFRPLFAGAIITGVLFVGAAHADELDIDFGPKRGLEFEGDGWSWQFGGRIHADSAWFDEDVTPFDDEADFRRARVKTRLNVADDWRLGAEYDFGGTNTGWKTAYLQYRGVDHLRVTAGNHIAPLGMAELGSSNDDPFMEQPLASALSPGLLMGVSASTWGRGWTAAGGYFADELSNESQRKSEGEGGVLRLTTAPIRAKGKLLHLGVSGEYRTPSDDDLIRLRTRPESYMTDVRLVDTGVIAGVDDTVTLAAESAIIAGPLTLQGEYLAMSVSRDVGSDLDFSGWYGTASIMLTGERREYSRSRGVVEGPRIRRDWGAVEAAVRYGALDLNDQDVAGGEETNLGFALNWYLNRNVRLMLNYILFEAEPNQDGVDEDGSLVSVRIQLVL
jgi:phosphate-selective porin OprO/OprP